MAAEVAGADAWDGSITAMASGPRPIIRITPEDILGTLGDPVNETIRTGRDCRLGNQKNERGMEARRWLGP